jgi:uncharacterized protein YqeY
MKEAMKSRDKERLGTIRLIQSEFKRIEVDERIELDEARVLAILDKMVKQRRDSQAQYEEAGRDELAAQEAAEIAVIQEFLPAQLSDEELDALIDEAIARPTDRACRPWAPSWAAQAAAPGPRRHGRREPEGQGPPDRVDA